VALRDRLRRLRRKAEEDGILIRQVDGSVRAFDRMDALGQLFLARYDITIGRGVPDNPVMRAYQNASPEGGRAVEDLARDLDGGKMDLAQLVEEAETFEVEDLSE
jgi:hypothetical protein